MNQSVCKDRAARIRIGKRAGLMGIVCNTLLSAGKILMGALSGSASVTVDGINNLTDAAGAVITLLGFKFSEKPADEEHPYGHARYEYLAGLAVSLLILVLGVEFAKTSIQKILHPTAVAVSPLMVGVLTVSVAAKVCMYVFFRRAAKGIDSTALTAAAADSRNDAITTAAALAGVLTEHYTALHVDGMMGLAIALLILFSGVLLAKETISPLLGKGANPQLNAQITGFLCACPEVLGCHDLLVHDYGAGRCYGSIHVEMDQRLDAKTCHEIIDRLERDVLQQFGLHLVVHVDPIAAGDTGEI